MRSATPVLAGLAAVMAVGAASCERRSPTREVPPFASAAPFVQESRLVPGEPVPRPAVRNPYESDAGAITEGKRLYNWFGCAGCHSPGLGGGMGPPLIDEKWIYGSSPENIYHTIVVGRSNGMPAFRGKIPSQDIWKLAAFIRASAGLAKNPTGEGVTGGWRATREVPMPSSLRGTGSATPPMAEAEAQ